MAKHMSFSKTIEQMERRTKSETMRMGWEDLKRGDVLIAVEKAQGLQKGETVVKIVPIIIKSNTPTIVMDVSPENCINEGFPEYSPSDFIAMFCELNKCKPFDDVNRIGFDYIYWEELALIEHRNKMIKAHRKIWVNCADCEYHPLHLEVKHANTCGNSNTCIDHKLFTERIDTFEYLDNLRVATK